MLQIIHTHVNGALNLIGFGGGRYFVIMVGDFNKLTALIFIVWVFCVDFVNIVQNHIRKWIKEIRYDIGTE